MENAPSRPITRRRFLAATIAASTFPRLAPSLAAAAPTGVNAWTPDPAGWREKAFPDPGAPKDQVARFERLSDPQRGPVLSVGPFEAGQWSARWEHQDKLPWREGTITGHYRTEGLDAPVAAVMVQFFKGSQKIVQRSEPLAPAADWTPFEVAVRWAPPAAEAFAVALGLGAHTRGRAFFSGISARPTVAPLTFPADPGPWKRPAPPRGLAAGKYFRIEKANGAWWMVAPDGVAALSLGIDGMARRDRMTGAQAAEVARGLGFNAMGGWSSAATWRKANAELRRAGRPMMPAFLTLQTGSLGGGFAVMVDAAGAGPRDEHAMPDPFDPRYEVALRAKIRSRLAEGANESWLAGWFADNEADLRDLHRRVWSEHCSRALIEFLKKKHQTIGALNARWGTRHASFDALRAAKPDPAQRAGAMFEDFWAFRREVVRQWVAVGLRAIREEDPGRLAFSNRFHRSVELELADLLDLFAPFDGIAANLYPQNRNVGLNDAEKDYLRRFHEKTGRPVLVTEWSIPALDSGLYNQASGLDWSMETAVGTQEERARQAACVLTEMLNMPFILGAHWFIWQDYDNAKRHANRGLVKANGQPWTQLQQALKQVNLRAQKSVS